MTKKEIKRILMSLRNNCNENLVNNMLGKIDLLSDEEIQQKIIEIGDDEDRIRNAFIKKLEELSREDKNNIYYYSNAEKDKRESRTFSQIKDVIEKVLKMLKENNLSIYLGGGTVPYILLNQESGRLHDDVDTICKIEDIDQLREFFRVEGLYDPERDSKNYAKDGNDYGFEMKIDGVPFGIYPFQYKDGIITQYSFDPYNKLCKTKTISIEQLSDYIYTYEGRNGKTYNTMSLEYIKLTKDYTRRPKDIVDSKKISEYGIRNDVMCRITIYKEVKSER